MNNANMQKTTKARMLLPAGLVIAVAAVMAGAGGMNVLAEQNTGTTTINLVQEEPVSTKMVEEANRVWRQMELNDSESERAKLDASLDDIQEKLYDMVPSRTDAEVQHHRKLGAMLVEDLLAHTTENGIALDDFVPIESVGYDVFENALGVGIHHEFVTEDNMKSYAKRIRHIIGDEVDLVLHNATRPDMNVCSRTGTCDPVQGGVRFASSSGLCTVGYKATYNHMTGFVTAGHCVDGLVGTYVGQPGLSNRVGIVRAETYNHGTNTACDCAFIQTANGRTMSNSIYRVATPVDTGLPTVHKLVKMSGAVSGVTLGAITGGWEIIKFSDGTIYETVIPANYLSVSGNSGAPVISRGDLTADLLGIHLASNGITGSVSKSYFVPVQTIESSMSGISWGF